MVVCRVYRVAHVSGDMTRPRSAKLKTKYVACGKSSKPPGHGATHRQALAHTIRRRRGVLCPRMSAHTETATAELERLSSRSRALRRRSEYQSQR
eukprot:3230540-Prymnesium_polylepis.3